MDRHAKLLPFGKYQGDSIDDVMRTNPQYLAWFVDNIRKFKGDDPLADAAIEEIGRHPQFSQAWDAYQQEKATEKKWKAERKKRERERNRERQRQMRGDTPKRFRGRLDRELNLFIPQVRPLEPSQVSQQYRWCFSDNELESVFQRPEMMPAKERVVQIDLRMQPGLRYQGKILAVGGGVGWLVMKTMQVTTPPIQMYSIAAAMTFDLVPIDPYALEQLFPYATRVVPIQKRGDCHISSELYRELRRTLKLHMQVSLDHWQEMRIAYLDSQHAANVQSLTARIRSLEEEYRRVRLSSGCSGDKDRLRSELLAAEFRESEAERSHSLQVAARPEVKMKTLFALEWATV